MVLHFLNGEGDVYFTQVPLNRAVMKRQFTDYLLTVLEEDWQMYPLVCPENLVSLNLVWNNIKILTNDVFCWCSNS